jgi:hypothetical protein
MVVMKKIILFIASSIVLGISSCTVIDKGNYDYKDVPRPVVSNLDEEYSVLLGEELTITPTVTIDGESDFSFKWKVLLTTENIESEGPTFKFAPTSEVGSWSAKLILTNNVNGAKYIYPFTIKTSTVFSTGVMVLSSESGVARLSFVKPDNTVMPRIFKTMHSRDLPGKPQQLIAANFWWGMQFYWIICGEGDDPGVKLDPNTMGVMRTVRENFVVPHSDPLTFGYQFQRSNGSALIGILNGKLAQTYAIGYPLSDPYGMWGDGYLVKGDGNYKMGNSFIYVDYQYMYGYDESGKKLIRFTSDGVWVGDNYDVSSPAAGEVSAFDPKNMGMDKVLYMCLIGTTHLAFCQDASGKVYEFQFLRSQAAKDIITPVLKREFAGSSLVKSNSMWLSSVTNDFYVSSTDKIYRYNRITQDLKLLNASFTGDEITMMKFADNNTLLVGVKSGKIYYVDITLGVDGNIISGKTISGIPGSPVDAYIRLY